jgi:hypothetical protein
MTALKTHLIKALNKRKAAIDAHRAALIRQAAQDSTTADLVANLAAANRAAAAAPSQSPERRQA